MLLQLPLATPLQESFGHTCAQPSPNHDSRPQECHLLGVSSQFPRDREGELGAKPPLSSATVSCFPPARLYRGTGWKFIFGSLASTVYIKLVF